jgi:DNA-binding NtrC family response regulator
MTAETAPPVTTPRAPRIMLVDDEPYILEALQRQLRAEPIEVLPFNDPLKALESFFQAGEFAVIVSDNLMPGLKGLELLARAREFAPQVRRVLLTGHTDLNQAIEAFNEGLIHRFINKPWDTADLIGVLREELDKYRSAAPLGAERADAATPAGGAEGRLHQTVQELKQALTQVALYEDGNRTRRLRVTPQMRRLSFLVVDGNASVRRLLVTTLQKAGILAVTAVPSAEEALVYLRQVAAVDVILSEWTLPGVDGMGLFQALRGGETPSAKAIFILMTTRENRKAVEFALGQGVDYYLIKPFHLDSLFEQLDRRLRRSRKETPESRIAKLRKLHFVVSNSDQDSRYKIQQILLINGVQNVTIADSAAKALRVVQERRVDVLVLDCNLLDVYWPELRVQLDQLSGEQIPPTVVVTSVSPMPNEFERIYAAGITTFLPGPVRQREFLEGVFKALESDERTDVLDDLGSAAG